MSTAQQSSTCTSESEQSKSDAEVGKKEEKNVRCTCQAALHILRPTGAALLKEQKPARLCGPVTAASVDDGRAGDGGGEDGGECSWSMRASTKWRVKVTAARGIS